MARHVQSTSDLAAALNTKMLTIDEFTDFGLDLARRIRNRNHDFSGCARVASNGYFAMARR